MKIRAAPQFGTFQEKKIHALRNYFEINILRFNRLKREASLVLSGFRHLFLTTSIPQNLYQCKTKKIKLKTKPAF